MLKIQLCDGQVTDHFNINEFKCRNAGEMILNKEVIEHIFRLEKFRTWYGRPMIIDSGYRTPEYNAKIGGVKKSQHILGVATDFSLPLDEFKKYDKERIEEFYNNVKNKWFELCEADGVKGGVGFYDTFIHLDSRTEKQSFWDMRTRNKIDG